MAESDTCKLQHSIMNFYLLIICVIILVLIGYIIHLKMRESQNNFKVQVKSNKSIKDQVIKQNNPNNDECVICLEELGTKFIKLSCSHLFHAKCLHDWFTTKTKCQAVCPYCKSVDRDLKIDHDFFKIVQEIQTDFKDNQSSRLDFIDDGVKIIDESKIIETDHGIDSGIEINQNEEISIDQSDHCHDSVYNNISIQDCNDNDCYQNSMVNENFVNSKNYDEKHKQE